MYTVFTDKLFSHVLDFEHLCQAFGQNLVVSYLVHRNMLRREREGGRETDRQTGRQTDRQRQRQSQTGTERFADICWHLDNHKISLISLTCKKVK